MKAQTAGSEEAKGHLKNITICFPAGLTFVLQASGLRSSLKRWLGGLIDLLSAHHDVN